MNDCVFCSIVAGLEPAARVMETPRSLAFCDLRQPSAAGHGAHVLVVPRQHVESLDQLDDRDAADLMQSAVRIAAAMKRAYGEEGLSLWQSNGEAAFQEVPHVHLHLITRRVDDRLRRIYPDRVPGSNPAQREDMARRLRAAMQEREPPGA